MIGSTPSSRQLILLIGTIENSYRGERMKFWSCLAAAGALLCAGCGTPATSLGVADGVRMDRYERDVRTLSSDEFGGRAPASPGEELTVEYLVSAFREAGLVGANAGSFLQEVPLVAITAEEVSPLSVETPEGTLQLAPGSEVVTWTKRVTDTIDVADSELVFIGYGVDAPEYGWNDYAGLDVRGKTVVMLVNDPGFASEDPALFTGRRMTYYGRWTYKFEEAARKGATGAILVHNTAAAGYPWGVVENGWVGPQFDLERDNGNADRAAFEGWITEAAATRLFAALGADFPALAAAAQVPGFQPVALDGAASVRIRNRLERSRSSNVVAMLPGKGAPEETVAISAHWDHLGTADRGEEDGIYNGAVDNASGTAALLEIARVMAASEHRRTVLFIAVTAEESGLLGSAWYAANPTVDLARMAGLINIDAMNIIGPTRDVTVIGYGSSSLERYLAEAAAAQDRRLEDEPTPEKGFFFRSDHVSFAREGVPVLYAKGGVDHVTEGRQYGMQRNVQHIVSRYHQPSDEVYPGWDWDGLELDMNLYLAVVRALANTDDWPEWSEGQAFREIRQTTASARQR